MTDKPHGYQCIADKYTGRDCTLDGKPARITGRLMPFAHITWDSGMGVQYSWPTVVFVMEHKDGKFRT